jgi:sugar phosphate isomerase/epimerase
MADNRNCSRRDFVKLTTGSVLAATVAMQPRATPAADAADEPAAAAPASRPKISCVSWNFHPLGAGNTRPEQAVELIGGLGFEGIELILTGPAEIGDYWTDATIDRIRKRLDHFHLQVPQFALFQPVVEELTSTNADERQKAIERFEAGCRIARKLGTSMVNIVAPWPRELRGPTVYLPRYFELEDVKPGQKFHIEIAAGFDWEAIWRQFVDTIKACLDRAKAHGLRFSLENHTHTVVPDTGSLLRLWDAVGDPAFGFNLDIGWISLEREYPPLAVHKAGRHLFNVHARDIDGLMHRFVHFGQGVNDFPAIANALKAVGFHGFISLEQDGQPGDKPDTMRETCQRYLATMKELLGAA